MGRRLSFIGGALILGFATSVSGNSPRDIPLEEQADRADLVIVGTARSTLSCDIKGLSEPCVLVDRVSIIRKNRGYKKTRLMRVVMNTGIDETQPDCCTIGKRYLMVLNQRRGLYYPFFGDISIVGLTDQGH